MQQQEAPRHPAAFAIFILSPRRRSHPSRRCLLSIKYLAGEGRCAHAAHSRSPWQENVRANVRADGAPTDLVAGPRRQRRRPMVARLDRERINNVVVMKIDGT